jgi:hypothetical protein
MFGFLTKIRQRCHFLFMETSYVGLVYGDSLRDNFVGYTPVDQPKFDELQAEFKTEMASKRPYLAKLLRIEAGLLETLPDHIVTARFWAVEDRFQRVVPLATRQRYNESVPKRGDVQWQDPVFVRDQTRTLVDVIHANYLINIGREKSVKRLKLIMAVAFVVLLLLLALAVYLITWWFGAGPWIIVEMSGYVALIVAGVLGATLSIANRLQSAVSRDAMTEDGLFELTGLRIGWVGIVTSMVMGGAFALVLYWIVMAGVLDKALPVPQSGPNKAAVSATPPAKEVDDPKKPGEAMTSEGMGEIALPEAKTIDAAQSAALSEETSDQPGDTGNKSNSDYPLLVSPANSADADNSDEPTIYAALRLRTYPDFFKMLILAFLAGFAERFVPDILNRLGKTSER